MFLIILIKSLIIGGLVGVGVGAGAARMFHAPTTQGMGAFRTLGELNSCEGDPASHFSFGLGFFFNAWASSVAAGSFTQDVDHRIIPNWGAAALMLKNRNVGETLHDPKAMAHRSISGEPLPEVDASLFEEISEDSMMLAREVVAQFGNLPDEEAWLLSVHFEVAKENL